MNINISHISETAFLTLYCHAMDAKSKAPILNDKSSVCTSQVLTQGLSRSDNAFHKVLVSGNISRKLVVHTAIRAKKYDEYVVEFIRKHPKATVVNIGCGLDNRFERINNGKIDFFDLDLPEIIAIKRHFFQETRHYHYISQSVFDFTWLEKIRNNNILFLAEGVFMYCQEPDVKSLFLKLQNSFPGSEMVCEVFNSLWLKGWLKKIMAFKMQKEFHLGKDVAFQFGIRNSDEIESWNQGIRLLDEWSYFDSDEKKLGMIKMLGKIELFRKTQWTVHYQLEKSE